jgi:MtN3 and saliva related transmembrane protein
MYKIIGMTAAALTMFAFVPQIIKALRTKSVHDVSIIMLIQLSLGVVLWLIYGLHLGDFIIVLANGVSLITLLIILALYYKYRRRKSALCR